MMSFETPPPPATFSNPFDYEPCTPRNSRVVTDLSRRILGNIDNLRAPCLSVPAVLRKEIPTKSSPKFDAALNRMRSGTTLERLKQQRDMETARQEEAMNRLRVISVQPSDKGISNPTVNLGRQAPERRSSGMARSA